MKSLTCLTVIFISSFSICFSQSAQFSDAVKYVGDYCNQHNIKPGGKNTLVDKNNVIHIFIFQDGNTLGPGYPTTATEKNKYQVHLIEVSGNKEQFLFEVSGSYVPQFNVESSGSSEKSLSFAGSTTKLDRYDYSIVGPYTDKFTLTLKHRVDDTKDYTVLSSADIQVAKRIWASIGAGFLYSTLKNPSNIKEVPTGNGDSTLLADDVNGKLTVSLMATFYPWGRDNLRIDDWTFRDRFGIVIGTSIADGASNFKNLFLGIQFDFATGGSIVAGAHYGERQKILGIDYKDFKFGETKFTGNLDDKKYMGWDFAFFFGIEVDSRIFAQLFK